MVLTTLTKNAAVNVLLTTVGAPPVVWVEPEVDPPNQSVPLPFGTDEERDAAGLIDELTRLVQIERNYLWSFVESKSFTASILGVVTLPSNTARVDYIDDDKLLPGDQARIFERNGQLYNATGETNNFGAGASVALKVTYFREFLELPVSVRYYICYAAKVQFLLRKNRSDSLVNQARLEENKARTIMEKDQNIRYMRNLFESDDTRRMIRRHYPVLRPLG